MSRKAWLLVGAVVAIAVGGGAYAAFMMSSEVIPGDCGFQVFVLPSRDAEGTRYTVTETHGGPYPLNTTWFEFREPDGPVSPRYTFAAAANGTIPDVAFHDAEPFLRLDEGDVLELRRAGNFTLEIFNDEQRFVGGPGGCQ